MKPASRPSKLDKTAFFESMGYTPHEGQKPVHASAAPRRVLACGVRWGKTTAAAMEGLAAAMEPRERSIGWVCAPTYDLADRVFREIQLHAVQHLKHRVITMRDADRKIVLRNMAGGLSEIRAKSADNPVSLLGEGLDWLIVDEAARLKPTIWQSHLSQRLIDKKGWALLISTPKGKGFFYDLFKRGKGDDPAYESWNSPSWTNPLLDRELIEDERGRLPERVFKQEFGAQFIEGAGAVFRNVRELATGAWHEPQKRKTYYGGLDLAKVEDYTVLVIVDEERRVVFADRFHRMPWSTQVARIKGAVERYGDVRLWVDSTGKGEPVFEALRNEGLFCRPYAFTSRSKGALIDSLALALEQRLVELPRYELLPELVEELEAFEYSISEHGNVKSSAPSGQHDDCVVALGLALWELRPGRAMPGGRFCG